MNNTPRGTMEHHDEGVYLIVVALALILYYLVIR